MRQDPFDSSVAAKWGTVTFESGAYPMQCTLFSLMGIMRNSRTALGTYRKLRKNKQQLSWLQLSLYPFPVRDCLVAPAERVSNGSEKELQPIPHIRKQRCPLLPLF